MLAHAWRQIRRRPWRFLAATGSVASSVVLVLVLGGLYRGLLAALVRYPHTLAGDVVVTEAGGSAAMLHAAAQISPAVEAAVRNTAGVARVDPLYGRLTWIERDGRQAIAFLIGLGRRDRFGRPVRVLRGARKPRLGEILVDRVLAHDLRIDVGDRLRIGDATLRVAAVTDGGNAVLASYAFVHRSALALAGFARPTFLFVRATAATPRADLTTRLAAIPDVRVLPRAQFDADNQALARQLLFPLILIAALISAAVSALIVALTLRTIAVERRAEFGIMAALGVPARWVEGTVVVESLVVCAVGAVLGGVATLALAAAIPRVEPRFVVAVSPALLATVLAGAAVVGVVAARAPLRAVAAVDPAEVFRV